MEPFFTMRSLSTGATCGRGVEWPAAAWGQVRVGGFLASNLPKMHFPPTQGLPGGTTHFCDADRGPTLPFLPQPTCLAFSTICFIPHLAYFLGHFLSNPHFPES